MSPSVTKGRIGFRAFVQALRTSPLPGLLLIALAGCGSPAQVQVSGAVVVGAEDAESVSIYGQIQGGPDTLLAISTPGATGSIHEMEMENGLMRMTSVDRVPVPNTGLALESGKLHGMLEDLSGNWIHGDSITLTFQFSNAGPVSIAAPFMSPVQYVGTPDHQHD